MVRLTGGLVVLAVYAWVLKPPTSARTQPNLEGNAGVETWIAASNEALEAGRYADALEPTSRLMERFPNQHVYAGRLATIFQKLDRPVDEAAAWERFVDLSPTPVEACPAIGNAYARAGERAKSLDAFERCVSFDPRNSEGLFFLGLAYERAGRATDAFDRYSQSVANDPSNTDSQLGLGRLSLRANRVDEARRAADAVLERFPRHADALLLAGLVAERQGRLEEAEAFLERALTVAAQYVDVQVALRRVKAAAGRPAGASR